MSKNRREMITCPECGKKSPFIVWDSVNTSIDPEMRAAVKDLSIFRFTCPKCGNSMPTDYDLLYHQMEDRIMIQYTHSDEYAEKVKGMFSANKSSDPMQRLLGGFLKDNLFRIVRSQYELREKIEIFDAGLDDRIIEIYKTFLLPVVSERYPRANKFDMFFLQLDHENLIQVLVDGRPASTMQMNQEIYEMLLNDFGSLLPDIRSDDPVIDRNYAFHCIEKYGSKLI